MILCEANCEQFCHLRCLFLCLKTVLGLKINLSKLEIVFVGDVDDVGVWLVFLGGVAYLPMKYLGFPLKISYKASTI